MKRPHLAALLLAFSFTVTSPAVVYSQCAIERGDIKNVKDPDRGLLFNRGRLKRARRITIEEMHVWDSPFPNPRGIPRRWFTQRYLPYEATVYVVEAKLTKYNRQGDGDYHLVLEDEAGRSIIVEIPNPECVHQGVRRYVSAARDAFDREFSGRARPVRDFKEANVRVRVSGIAMFDKIHGAEEGQVGVAPNGVELHPVLGIDFLD